MIYTNLEENVHDSVGDVSAKKDYKGNRNLLNSSMPSKMKPTDTSSSAITGQLVGDFFFSYILRLANVGDNMGIQF